ncbi:MAG: hypothetical protein KFW07_00220 [Mycoplasmataceae bacterium]|nr:hypothetical protein [Mycoplasmataceae bacterium]
MLNIPIIEKLPIQIENRDNQNDKKLSILEKIEYRQIIKKNYWKDIDNISISINKSSINGSFSITVRNIRQAERKIFLSINNKINYQSEVMSSKIPNQITINSDKLGNTLFKDITSIAIGISIKQIDWFDIFNQVKWIKISELNIKISEPSEQKNKIFFIDDNGLVVETYSSLNFIQKLNSVQLETQKSQIKILPKIMDIGKHNVEFFDVMNLSKNSSPLINVKEIFGLDIFANNKKLNATYQKINYGDKNKIGSIVFDENSFYNPKTSQTNIGIGPNSKKGYMIPYKFKGELTPTIKLDIHSMKDIFIGFFNPIKQAYFDKYSGLINLYLSESTENFDENYQSQTKILNKYFKNIISEDLTLEDLIKLGKLSEQDE